MTKKISTSEKVATGLGVATLTAGAAVAAAYYLTGKGAKKHQKQAKAWAKSAKAELVKKINSMEKFSKTAYDQASKEVLTKYKQVKNVTPEELSDFGQELKTHWDSISSHAQKLMNQKTKSKKTKRTKK